MLDELLEIVPRLWQFAIRLMNVENTCIELRGVLEELNSVVHDINTAANTEVRNSNNRKRKRSVVEAYFKQVQEYKDVVERTLDEMQRIGLTRNIRYVFSIERYLVEGNEYLRKGMELGSRGGRGLTIDEIKTRGEKLCVRDLMGETAERLLCRARQDLNRGNVNCIGIYGSAGAGKTNLMKHLYNSAHNDLDGFKAVFWAKAPREQTNWALQECVAQAMDFELNDDDVVRRASKLAERLNDLGPGRIILFLDNLKQCFDAYETIGFPRPRLENLECILVFTAPSMDVCNRMHCDSTLEMNLLLRDEAKELFLSVAGCPSGVTLNREQLEIQRVAREVADACARMPLAIILIAQSMKGIDDLREWRHRLNELMGRVETINDDDQSKILEQLQFAYTSMNLREIEHRCFKAAATLLVDDHQLHCLDIIESWKLEGIIGVGRSDEQANDQGQTIVNRLGRMCLVEIEKSNQNVSMNKWIRNMAATL